MTVRWRLALIWKMGFLLTRIASARIMFIQIMLQGVPTTPNSNHHVITQNLKDKSHQLYSVFGEPHCILLTLTKIRTCVSPILYFPSATLIIGNWVGHWHSDTNSLTWKVRKIVTKVDTSSKYQNSSLKENYSGKITINFLNIHYSTWVQVH